MLWENQNLLSSQLADAKKLINPGWNNVFSYSFYLQILLKQYFPHSSKITGSFRSE